MNHPSFAGVDSVPPALPDIGGLLAAPATVALTADGAVLTVTVDAPWRASEITRRLGALGVTSVITTEPDGLRVHTEPAASLVALVDRWTRDGTKHVPDDWVPGPGALRLWFVASGHMEVDGVRYVLGLDPESPATFPSLARALMRAGIAPTLVSPHDGRPGLWVSGARRLGHLAERLGAPPDDPAPRAIWPHEQHPERHM